MNKTLHGFKSIWKYRLSDYTLSTLYVDNQKLLDVDIPKSFAHKRTFRAVKKYVVENTEYTRETKYNPERAEYFDDMKCCDIIYNDYVAILVFRFMPGTLFLRQSEWAEKTCPDHGWWVGHLLGYLKDNEGVIGKYSNGFIRITGLKPCHYFPLIMTMLEDVDVRKRRYPPLKELRDEKEHGCYYPVPQTPLMKWSIKMLEECRRTLEESLEEVFNVNADTVILKLKEKKYALQTELSNALSGLNGVDDFIGVCKKARLWERAVTQLWVPTRRTADVLHLNKIRWYGFIDEYSSFKLVCLREQNPELFTFLMNETVIFNDMTEVMQRNLENWENSSTALKNIIRKQEQDKRDTAKVSNPKYAWGEGEIMYPDDRELRYVIREALSFDNAYDSYEPPYPYNKDFYY